MKKKKSKVLLNTVDILPFSQTFQCLKSYYLHSHSFTSMQITTGKLTIVIQYQAFVSHLYHFLNFRADGYKAGFVGSTNILKNIQQYQPVSTLIFSLGICISNELRFYMFSKCEQLHSISENDKVNFNQGNVIAYYNGSYQLLDSVR